MYSAFPGNCSVSYFSFVYGRSLWAELNGGENSLHWKANMLPLFSIMTLCPVPISTSFPSVDYILIFSLKGFCCMWNLRPKPVYDTFKCNNKFCLSNDEFKFPLTIEAWISILYTDWFYAFCRLSKKVKIYSVFLYPVYSLMHLLLFN